MTASRQLADMATAAAAGDIATLAGVVHSLKSASYRIGATRMGGLCIAIEAAAWERLRPEVEGSLSP